ncbi:replication protein, partial [Acinetobacter indicus]|uniref:replication protein n=1 Tax=Acinetobacter indicus TaxID=756892 RepID=UPI0032155519
MNARANLAHEPAAPQAEVVWFPKKERQVMSKKEEGYTRTPNSLIDDQIMAQLNDKAFKCLMFIVRQTSGFDRASHSISITQFQKYCGIKKRDTVMACIKELEDKKLIKVERKTGCLNVYSLTLNQSHETGLPSNGTSTVERD